MRTFWSKIGLGALAVFMVGMLSLTLFRQAKNAAAEALSTAIQTSARSVARTASASSYIPFRLNGETMGNVRHAQIQRHTSGTLPEVDLTVELDDPGLKHQLRDCVLVPEQHHNFDFDRGFECAEGLTGDLVEIGTVHFVNIDLERPLKVERDIASDMQKGDPFEATADAGGAVQVNASSANGEIVRLLADQHGANIKVNDDLGRALVRLFADSTGAMIRVKGKDGRDVVKLDAGDGKFSLSIDTSAAH